MALACSEGPDLLVLGEPEGDEKAPAPCAAPAPLSHQKVADLHARGFPWAAQDDLSRRNLLRRDLALQISPRQPNAIGVVKRPQMLRGSRRRGCVAHVDPPQIFSLLPVSHHRARSRAAL